MQTRLLYHSATSRARSFRLLLSALLAIGASPHVLADSPELLFCYENDNVRPWQTRDGGGLNFDLLNQVAARLKLRFRYQPVPWKRCLTDLRNNVYAGALDASFKPERMENGVYPMYSDDAIQADAGKALHVERYVVIRRRGSVADWDGHAFSQLTRPAGAPLGYSVADDLRRTGITVDEGSPTATEVLQKLILARIDVAVLLQGEVIAMLSENAQLREKVEILPQPYAEKPYYLMLSHRLVKADPKLADRIWSGIARERATTTWQDKERQAIGSIKQKPARALPN